MSADIDKLLEVTRGEVTADDPSVQEALSLAAQMRTVSAVVPPHVPLAGARVAFVGETVGKEEVLQKRPFVGVAGRELQAWCADAGLDISKAYLDNVFPVRNPEALAPDVRQAYIDDCVERVMAQNVEVIALLGNEALAAFMRGDKFRGIMKQRGSVYHTGGRYIIPALNPAAVLRNTQWRRRSVFDMQRVAQVSDGQYEEPWYRIYQIRVDQSKSVYSTPNGGSNPTPVDTEALNIKMLLRHCSEGKPPWHKLIIDIETASQDECISCVGFSATDLASVVFEWPRADDVSFKATEIRSVVKQLCGSPVAKVLHNGLYDAWWLKREGIDIVNWDSDTMELAQAWYPADNLSLEYLTSILTNLPYYKDEGEDHYKQLPTNDEGWQQLMHYCGLDTIATWKVGEKLSEHFDEDLSNYYNETYPPMRKPMLDLMLQGVRVDNEARRKGLADFMSDSRSARDALMDYNDGEPLFTLTTQRDRRVWETMCKGGALWSIPKTAKTVYSSSEVLRSIETIESKTVSNKQLQNLLYVKMGLPVQMEKRGKGSETPTTGDLALRTLLAEYGDDERVRKVIELVLTHRKAHKYAEFCYDDTVDHDGRMRFSLKLTPETGRLASSKSPKGRGRNSQNFPRRDPRRGWDVRHWILPEEGHVLLKIDLSQVEARFCFMYTRDPELVRLANARPGEYDQHTENAILFGLGKEGAVSKEARQTSKVVGHGAQRDMQAETLHATLLKAADLDRVVEVPPIERCAEMLDAYHRRCPAIRGVFFEETRRKMREERKLTNSWGRTWALLHEDLDDEAMRRAFSFILQSEAADLLNRRAFVPLWQKLRNFESRIMLHIHDELVFSCSVDEVHFVAQEMTRLITSPLEIQGNQLSVPVEYGLGSSWDVSHEWKVLPSKDEMEEVARGLLG